MDETTVEPEVVLLARAAETPLSLSSPYVFWLTWFAVVAGSGLLFLVARRWHARR